MDQVKHVEYVLHETFPEPIRTIEDPEDGFVMKTSGWGEFELKAFVYMNDGSVEKLDHKVQLEHEPKAGKSA